MIDAGVTHLLSRPQPLPRYETFTVVTQIAAAGDVEGAVYPMSVMVMNPSGHVIASQERQVAVPAPPTKSIPNIFIALFAFAGVRVTDEGKYQILVNVQADDSTKSGGAKQFDFYIG